MSSLTPRPHSRLPNLQKSQQFVRTSWLRSRGKLSSLCKSTRQELKRLFIQLDTTNSGLVSVEELYEPLISLNLIQNKSEVEFLAKYANSKSSGVLNFDDFLRIFENSEGNRKSVELQTLIKKISGNVKEFNREDLPFSISVCNKRREMVMSSYIGGCEKDRKKGMRIINALAAEVGSNKVLCKDQRIVERRKNECEEYKRAEIRNRVRAAGRSERRAEMSFLQYSPPVGKKGCNSPMARVLLKSNSRKIRLQANL